ncbi:DctP family TRAP transporter solute-binding subunit [Metabacillus arenae]|uniref:DctP family TRAP transporter solute-binding subunit n=1 Tax=Metabacillus arenae TaxID=2771434 RepID=A0A926NGW5_9BACI|nr:DctP family TRAP transporter solute-binding subunit [Metabacillus arenae]MBD1379793.1 DctP family TRAP transporter solute-binding subunit [Metabacillus arenae]
MKKLFVILTAITLICVLAACGGKETSGGEASAKVEAVTFKLATPDPDDSDVTVAANELAKVVEEKSNGKIKISVHANGTLYGGDPAAAIKQLGAGSLDMLALSSSLYANFEPKYSAISIPYLFNDKEQYVSFINGDPGKKLLDSVDQLNIKALGYWPRNFRQITNSKGPIEKPEDLKGVKLRVPNNPLWVEFFKNTGAVTTPMDFSEVYNALQLGAIDGQENPLSVIKAAKMNEVQKYTTISNHMADAWVVGINSKKFNQLSEDQQKILLDAVKEVQSWKLDYDEKETEETIEFLKDHGVKVNELTSEQQQKFVDVSKQAYPEFKKLVRDDAFFEEVLKFVGKNE